ncbi:phospholipid-translocating P-type ATPase [Basidiobolus meristosporus CBS 931.73]|uniref:Phospholipid-transporting ATPase n=1 Tax=Basidiobolus meristosporus CBS 931.73 TaxID=1314790 RepID=A0A1Y1Z5U2_9FUNG|nr:phospholipid-translocating P-type ATPase [Basidiobolus meristosporus CBS 931.73]|eukprot:ORY05623.1 phospholipid-translocating P-type ATPase [Basidiobolus meristosporus CBS 931.73]
MGKINFGGRRFLPSQREKAKRKRVEKSLLRSPSRHRRSGETLQIYVNIQLPPRALNRHGLPKKQFPSNRIRTSKYTVFNFLPKNLFEQFRRVANMYFLFMAILQFLPYVGVSSPIFSIMPLITVISITAIKDGVEDYKRHRTDLNYNSSKTQLLQNWINTNHPLQQPTIWQRIQYSVSDVVTAPLYKYKLFGFIDDDTQNNRNEDVVFQESYSDTTEFREALWQDIRVGDIVYLKNNETCPADLVILSSGEPDGECFIETKELDGETNLKTRLSIDETLHLKTPTDFANTRFYIDSEMPSSNLYAYQATMHIYSNDESDKSQGGSRKRASAVPINISNTLLRGHVIRNTSYVIGVAVFTGSDTKILLNSGLTPSKRSKIEKAMNRQVIMNFIILLVLCLLCAIANGIMEGKGQSSINDSASDSPFTLAFLTFWSSLIIFQNIIPISLYVSVEFVKTWQWNLSDDLGQIEYIFSDKTGTLTRNIMEFCKCSINGRAPETDAARGARERQGIRQETGKTSNFTRKKVFQSYLKEMKNLYEPKYACVDFEKLSFIDSKIFKDLMVLKESNVLVPDEMVQAEKIRDFFSLLAVCHTVVIEKPDEIVPGQLPFAYRAESPDESALVSAARDLGFSFLGRAKNLMTLDVLGDEMEFELLQILEFNSTRKRMSVIVRRPAPWNDLVLLIKGADNIILERLADGQDDLVNSTAQHIDQFSVDGLRTLCLAYRPLSEEFYQQWVKNLQEASTSLDNRDAEIEKVYEEIETELLLIGATAIEDKLQENGPECILALRQAGIKIWVLTGDRMQTAINIGFACNLLTNDMELWTIKGDDKESAKMEFYDVVSSIRGEKEHHLRRTSYFDSLPPPRRSLNINRSNKVHALVIEGSALKYILEDTECRTQLLEIAPLCRSVICCRVSPLQKAQIVHMVKKGRKAVCLAIGDGANDVSMIQAADVGVAISGEEGLQAAMAADYNFSQFKYLENLLLVHGFWSYLRIAEMVLNFFYKNVVFVLVILWYQFFCGFSANTFFDFTYVQLYNLVFTLMPVVVLGTCDQAVSYQNAQRFPSLYMLGIQQSRYGMRRFWLYIGEAVYQSLACFFTFYFLFGNNLNTNGADSDLYDFSTSVSVAIISIATLTVGINSYTWNWIMFASVVGSILAVHLYAFIYSLLGSAESNGTGTYIYGSLSFWAAYFLSIFLAIFPRYIVLFIKQVWYYEDIDIVREMEKYGEGIQLSSPEDCESVARLTLHPYSNSTLSSRKSSFGDDDYLELSPIQAESSIK